MRSRNGGRALLCCTALVGSILAVPVSAIGAPSAALGTLVEHVGNGTFRYSDPATGLVVAGGPGLVVEVTNPDPGSVAGSVRTPDVDEDVQAAEYHSLGRSPVNDAIAAGISGTLLDRLVTQWNSYVSGGIGTNQINGDSQVYDSFCLRDNNGNIKVEACVIRARWTDDGDSTYNYYVDETQGTGRETSDIPWIRLKSLGVSNEYHNSGVTIVRRDPGSDIERENCVGYGFGVDIAGFGASVSGEVCPDKWDYSSSNTQVPRYHKVVWRGSSQSDREAIALTIAKKKPTVPRSYRLRWNASWG